MVSTNHGNVNIVALLSSQERRKRKIVATLGCVVVLLGLTLLQVTSSTAVFAVPSSSISTGDVPSLLVHRQQHGYQKNSFLGTDVLFIVMGQKKFFQRWYNRLRDDDSSSINNENDDDDRSPNAISTTFVYGSYDKPVPVNASIPCSYLNASKEGAIARQSRPKQGLTHCQTHYIPETTWTEGRNLLAKEAILLEQKRGKKFDFWVFSDDDVALVCQHNSTVDDARTCWQTFLRFLGGQPEELPTNANIVSIQWRQSTRIYNDSWVGVSTTDAMINAFRRDYAPYVLPYATLRPGSSEYLSQGILLCIIMTCAPSSVLFVPNMIARNPLHRNYIRSNYGPTPIAAAAHYNYIHYMNISRDCETYRYQKENQRIGPFSSAREFNAHVPTPKTADYCAPLANRFSDWTASVLLSTGGLASS